MDKHRYTWSTALGVYEEHFAASKTQRIIVDEEIPYFIRSIRLL